MSLSKAIPVARDKSATDFARAQSKIYVKNHVLETVMRIARTLMWTLATASLGACSAYPLPQDTTGSPTSSIVSNIRCQARRAVRNTAAKVLREKGNMPVLGNLTGSYLADLFEDLNRDIDKNINVKNFSDKELKDAFAYYQTTMVTYEFTLQMKEDNKQGIGIDLIRRFNRRLDTIGIGVIEDRSRDVSRIFVLHDSFKHLASGLKASYCQKKPDFDLVFPARGHLPVEDLVKTYIDLNEWGTLDKAEKPDLEGTKKGPATRQMADTILFTTKITGTNNPTIAYNPVGLGFFTAGLSFTNENARSDIHKVIITLTTSDVPDGKGDYKAIEPDALRDTGNQAIQSVRTKNFQDDLGTIARSLSQNSLSGF